MRVHLDFKVLFLFVLLFPQGVSASVIINEFSSGSDPEWVELFNDTDQPQDLTGWSLKDSSQKPKPLSGVIPPHGFYVYSQKAGWLNNSGLETLSLLDSSSPSAQIDSVNFGNASLRSPSADECIARIPDAGPWYSPLTCTQNAINGPLPTSTPAPPTPTPVSTHTPKPPTLAPSPKPTALPTNTAPAPKLTFIPTITPTITPISSPSAVLGQSVSITPIAQVVSATTQPFKDTLPQVHKKSNLPYILIAIGALIVASSAGLAYLRHRWYTS